MPCASTGYFVRMNSTMLEDRAGISYLDHEGERIAFRSSAGRGPGIFFMPGFGSDMSGSKAEFLSTLAQQQGIAFIRLDYTGHGLSSGTMRDGTLTRWLSDALAVFDAATTGPQIVVGSSMGGWLALHIALARPQRIRALVGIAAAPDFTHDLIWDRLEGVQKRQMQTTGFIEVPSDYGAPQIITLGLIESGRALSLLQGTVDIDCSVRLIHGMRDRDVPWQTSLRLAEALKSEDVRVHLVKDGAHRLSRDEDMTLLRDIVLDLAL